MRGPCGSYRELVVAIEGEWECHACRGELRHVGLDALDLTFACAACGVTVTAFARDGCVYGWVEAVREPGRGWRPG